MKEQQYFNLTGKLSTLLSTIVPNTNPEVFNWVYSQIYNGKAYEAIESELIANGWPQPISQNIINYAREDYPLKINPNFKLENKIFKQTPLQNGYSNNEDKNKITKNPQMPGVVFDNYPNLVDVGDKTLQITVSIDLPRIIVVDNFLSDFECDKLIEISESKLERSKTMGVVNYAKPENHSSRTSSGTFLPTKENPIIETIENRISKFLNWENYLGDSLQILKYEPGQEYKPHYDYFSKDYSEKEKNGLKIGQRCGTLLMYLSDTTSGGQTIFPETGINIHPKKGSAMFFSYDDNPSSLSLHGGSPVIEGVKWVATKWLRKAI